MQSSRSCLLMLVVPLLIFCIVGYFLFNSFSKKYSHPSFDKKYEGIVENVVDYKGRSYVTLKTNVKLRFDPSRNYQYDPYALSDFLSEGDTILKKEKSDTLLVTRNNKTFLFVLGEFLNAK